jgi:glycosyltransferase involved in cell wall biosynthesis
MCRGLTKRGHQVTLLTTNADGGGFIDVPLGIPVDQEGVETYFYQAQLGNVFSFPMATALKHMVPQSDIVLIHSLYQFTSTMAAHYCRKFNVPYVLRPHGTLDPFLVYRRRWLLKWAYIKLFEVRNFRGAAAVQYSSAMEEEMTQRFVGGQIRSFVIPEGIGLEKFANIPVRGSFRTRYPEMVGKTLILFLGRFDQKKGIELLVESFNDLALRRADVHLLLVGGGDSDYINKIMEMLQDRGIAHRSTYTGMVSEQDKIGALIDADIFVLPSRGENFGIAVVEAMACGIPVIISDQVGIWQDVADGDAGIVTRCDSGEIISAMEELVDNPFRMRKLGINGKNLVETQFTQSRMAERMEEAFSRLIVEFRALS